MRFKKIFFLKAKRRKSVVYLLALPPTSLRLLLDDNHGALDRGEGVFGFFGRTLWCTVCTVMCGGDLVEEQCTAVA